MQSQAACHIRHGASNAPSISGAEGAGAGAGPSPPAREEAALINRALEKSPFLGGRLKTNSNMCSPAMSAGRQRSEKLLQGGGSGETSLADNIVGRNGAGFLRRMQAGRALKVTEIGLEKRRKATASCGEILQERESRLRLKVHQHQISLKEGLPFTVEGRGRAMQGQESLGCTAMVCLTCHSFAGG